MKPKMNEATVRAEKLDPLIQKLGYSFNTDLNVFREHQFAYPKVSLGRKSKNDKPIVGKPDYICEARGIATWVLEAKAEGVSLGKEEDAQAYTYAAHPEIRALYYCLSDGVSFLIYKTISPPGTPCLLNVSLENLDAAAIAISAFLSKDALRAAVIINENDKRIPTSPDFEIISGQAFFDEINYEVNAPEFVRQSVMSFVSEQIDLLKGTIYPIESGSLEVSNGYLNLSVELGGHTQRDIEFQKVLGIDFLKFQSIGNAISSNIDNPTIFQTTQRASLKQGDVIQSSRVAPQILQVSLDFQISVDAIVHREGRKIIGKFRYSSESPIVGLGDAMQIGVYLQGRLDINIE